MCCTSYQINHMTIAGVLEHFECLSKTQISHDIKSQIVTPICHILRCTPFALGFGLLRYKRWRFGKRGTESAYVSQYILFHALDSVVRECMRQDPAFPCVASFVDAAVCVEGIFCGWEHRVELWLFHICTVTIDSLQGGIGVDGKAIRAKPNNGAWTLSISLRFVWISPRVTVSLVHSPELQMAVASPGMINWVPILTYVRSVLCLKRHVRWKWTLSHRDFGQEGPRILRQRVQSQAICRE